MLKPAKKSLNLTTSNVADFKDYGHIRDHQWTLGRKTMDETFYDDYKEALLEVIGICPIVYNLNVGHATQNNCPLQVQHAHVRCNGASHSL